MRIVINILPVVLIQDSQKAIIVQTEVMVKKCQIVQANAVQKLKGVFEKIYLMVLRARAGGALIK
ncbi:Predicted protein [Wolbachia endosymbiont strain TRS of Brugia malayi]|nr:Predicted protein [Wolbachia endosymbiont strain TRS of Brugia malayi]